MNHLLSQILIADESKNFSALKNICCFQMTPDLWPTQERLDRSLTVY